ANALKHAAGSPVSVSVSPFGEQQVRLCVKDEGPGISREDNERIFSQLERAAHPNVAGMGLGLWIVRRIVAAHGGTISVDSEPGRGASFTALFPAAQSEEGNDDVRLHPGR